MTQCTWLVVVASLVALPGAIAMAQQNTPAPASGLWHLLAFDASEEVIPQHRVDIRLYLSPAPIRAAMVNRATNQDMQPFSVAEFDGHTLRLGQRSENPGSQGRLVVLRMTWDGVRFAGRYVDDEGTPMPGAVALKLVRSTQ
jgi:hypothetical protein